MENNRSQFGILIIYSALRLGGIETFFVRLAKERYGKGLKTYLILLEIKKSNQELLIEAQKYAEVIDVKNLLKTPIEKLADLLPISLLLMMGFPLISSEKSKLILQKSTILHVFKPLTAHFSLRILKKVGLNRPITVGFYHTEPFIYCRDKKRPYYDEKCYDLIINQLPKDNLIIFNDKLPFLFKKIYNLDYFGSSIFPLGVIDKSTISSNLSSAKTININKNVLKICSIGRLVDFKTYNLWMPEVINELNKKGYEIEYDIYGDGPLKPILQQKLIDENIKKVKLCGEIPYSKFEQTVKKYDLFVGSGTALIEASAYGIPSIVGIENSTKPETYGFFSRIEGFSYNELGLYPTVSVAKLIGEFASITLEKLEILKNDHIEKASIFTIEYCSENFEKLEKTVKSVNVESVKYNSFFFIISYFIKKFFVKIRIY